MIRTAPSKDFKLSTLEDKMKYVNAMVFIDIACKDTNTEIDFSDIDEASLYFGRVYKHTADEVETVYSRIHKKQYRNLNELELVTHINIVNLSLKSCADMQYFMDTITEFKLAEHKFNSLYDKMSEHVAQALSKSHIDNMFSNTIGAILTGYINMNAQAKLNKYMWVYTEELDEDDDDIDENERVLISIDDCFKLIQSFNLVAYDLCVAAGFSEADALKQAITDKPEDVLDLPSDFSM